MSLRIACVGGGPGGLFFATLVKTARPDAEVTVFERNRADDTFGFGVVFSDATLASIHAADPVLRDALETHGVHWDRIEVRVKGERWGCSGNGMAAIVRKTLLSLLQHRARQAGVDLRFQTEVDLQGVAGYDLVVAADGANSRIRDKLAAQFQPSFDTATAKFIWFGTTYHFDGLTFVHESGSDGVFAVHGYPIGDGVSTFIVETDEQTWRRAGLDEFDVSQPPGPSDLKSKEYLEKLFADQLDGQALLVNNSRWGNFRTRRARRWHHGNVVLLGDAAHTAHFSVGSGTKMAMEDAIALARALEQDADDIPAALSAYEAAARPSVDKIQRSARPSLSWWEHFGRYHDALDPWQFSFHFMSRSITSDRLDRRDPEYVRDIRSRWRQAHGRAPLTSPLHTRRVALTGRVSVFSPDTSTELRPADHDGTRLPVVGAAAVPPDGPWALLVSAPGAEAELPEAIAQLRAGLDSRPDLVAVQGGSRLTRTLLAEEARMGAGVPAALVEDDLTEDDAQTLLLSGRADLIATRSETLARWRQR
jgi:2-polyprenyl-6-methoxyphenol hydroxylase-like FAD-dependent oxidoreductase